MKYLKVIAFTHKKVQLDNLGKLIIPADHLIEVLNKIRQQFDIPEIFYIGTCNRVEFVFSASQPLTEQFSRKFIETINFNLSKEELNYFLQNVILYEHVEALNHLLRISCSLESLVVGEKEILAQIRKSYEICRQAGLTGDYLRMIMDCVVKTAKTVYTNTSIARKPVSVVSLAYRQLRELKMTNNARILIIGAGETNKNFSKYLQKHKFINFTIFNRTVEKAQKLAHDLNAQVYSLENLKNYTAGFDVIITCTGATEPIIDCSLYEYLLKGDRDKKIIVDLGIPSDVSIDVIKKYPINYIDIKSLQQIANQNMRERREHLVHAEQIICQSINEFIPLLKQRRVELAMREVPMKIKEIRQKALHKIFADEISNMDEKSRQTLAKVMDYMEKKYISVPMVMAKEILVSNS